MYAIIPAYFTKFNNIVVSSNLSSICFRVSGKLITGDDVSCEGVDFFFILKVGIEKPVFFFVLSSMGVEAATSCFCSTNDRYCVSKVKIVFTILFILSSSVSYILELSILLTSILRPSILVSKNVSCLYNNSDSLAVLACFASNSFKFLFLRSISVILLPS